MFKRIAILVLILTISIMLSSCAESYRVWKDLCNEYPDLMGKVQTIPDDEDSYYVKYEGQRYNIDKLSLFRVRENFNEIPENDVLISWYTLPFGIVYLDKYYSYTYDNPTFIYISRFDELYLRNDYNYETDMFVIEGTNQKFVFGDMFALSNAFSYNIIEHYPSEINITLYSYSCPRLEIQLRLFCVNNVWYAGGNSDNAIFEVAGEFIELVINSGYICAQ